MPENAETNLNTLSAAQNQRLKYIEFCLWFCGNVRRKDIVKRFGLATAAGTRDLALYMQLAPQNATYQQKMHIFQPEFQPLFEHDIAQVLSELTAGFGIGSRNQKKALISHASAMRLTMPSIQVLAAVTRAIYGKYAINMQYHSISSGLEHKEVVPHSIVDSGLRWHVRAYDRTKNSFRDLVLTRMKNINVVNDPATLSQSKANNNELISADEEWNRTVPLKLIAHPAQAHKKSIEFDLGMKNGHLIVNVRAVMAGYLLRQWLVDCSKNAFLNGPEYRLYLANQEVLQTVKNAVLAPGYAV